MSASTARSIVGLAAFVGLWQLLASLGWINPVLLPAPATLFSAAWELLSGAAVLRGSS